MFDSFTNKKSANGKFSSLDSKDLVGGDQVLDFKLGLDRKFILISGPTGVGKSDFAEYLAAHLGCDTVIINGDMGQVYTPLSIGTSKPEDLSNSYLFNVVDQPLNLGAYAFRNMVAKRLKECWLERKIPIIVGGSGFYMKSLFYPPTSLDQVDEDSDTKIIFEFKDKSTQDLYIKLKNIDQVRAEQIHPNDRYRIERALFLWEKTLSKPSELRPKFEPLGSCFYYFLTRDKQQLKNRIDERVGKMLEVGWIEEVKSLNDAWKKFLLKKKLIGYPDIIQYLEEGNNNQDNLVKIIKCKTSQYAKRQFTFWRSLQNQLIASDTNKEYIKDIQVFDLTNNFECLKDIIMKKINES
jgi:tRNA dimethylallyltransferase